MNNKNEKRIILDCDGVLSNFVLGILKEAEKAGLGDKFPKVPEDVQCWNICDEFYPLFCKVRVNDEFWLNLEPLQTRKLNFIPFAYLTARVCDSSVTREWINKVGLPDAQVITVKDPLDKIAILKKLQPDAFIDDHLWTVKEAREAGINAYLYSQPYQKGHADEIKKFGLEDFVIKDLSELDTIVRGEKSARV